MREKLNSKVLFDEDTWTRFQNEVPKVSSQITSFHFTSLRLLSCMQISTTLYHFHLDDSQFIIAITIIHLFCYFCVPYSTPSLNVVPQMKLVTPSALVERLKINVSLARAACKQMAEEGKLTVVESHNKQQIYTRVAAV